ncbi:MAG: hypothetical protein AAB284_02955, partial [Chloroflexota bacterium]
MTRVVRTRVEFEGEVTDELALVEGEDLPAWSADRALEKVGKATPRIDGVQRVTGRARYTAD